MMENIIKTGDTVAFVRCSDALASKVDINYLIEVFNRKNINVIANDYIYDKTASAKERADFLNYYFGNSKIKAIFDVSGGDMANEIIEYLDFEMIRSNSKPFFGYSDLTCVINAINKKTAAISYLYQVRNIKFCNKEEFFSFLLYKDKDLLNFDYKFIRGNRISGVIVGGNIRCLLKLAGTEYFPDFKEKILFLESRSGNESRIRAFFAQLRQMGVFNLISGLILGSFTEFESRNNSESLIDIVLENTPENLVIMKTDEVGHQFDSKMIGIGKYVEIDKNSG